MPGGGGKSQTSTDKSITTETVTTTNIGDIGLTGSDAVALAAIVEGGVERVTRVTLEGLLPIIQASGKNAVQLVGGAGALETNLAPAISTGGAPLPAFAGGTDKLLLVVAGAGALVAILAFTK